MYQVSITAESVQLKLPDLGEGVGPFEFLAYHSNTIGAKNIVLLGEVALRRVQECAAEVSGPDFFNAECLDDLQSFSIVVEYVNLAVVQSDPDVDFSVFFRLRFVVLAESSDDLFRTIESRLHASCRLCVYEAE